MNYIIIYIIIINIFTFLVWGIDKYYAVNNKYRISEKNMIYLCILGGWIGGLIGSNIFHHKSSKIGFGKRIYLIAIIEIVLFIYIIVKI